MMDGNKKGHSHFFCVISVRDLLTTSNQKHIIPLLSFCRNSEMTAGTMVTLANKQMSNEIKQSDTNVAEKTDCHYHYSTNPCHHNTFQEGKNDPAQHNIMEATITMQVYINQVYDL